MIAFALLMFAVPQDATPAPDHFCTGIARVAVLPGEKITRSEGPDFSVVYVGRPDGTEFGVYIGNYAKVSNDERTEVLKRGGLPLYRMQSGGAFHGYLVTDSHELQNHFFGTVFKGDQGDLAFFDRVRFGPCTS